MPQMAMLHDVDPAKVILDRIGAELDKIDVLNDKILLGIYQRPTKTKSGIVLADQTREEDQFQGKAMLILKMGPLVNIESKLARGIEFAVGDWVAIRPSDGWPVKVNQQLCRLVDERAINMRIPAPDLIW